MNYPNRTELPKKEFRWNSENILEQLVEILQHRKDGDREVGIHKEWQKVKVSGEFVIFALDKV